MSTEKEVAKLEAEAERIMESEGAESANLNQVYERLEQVSV
jgi:hypothetical protein